MEIEAYDFMKTNEDKHWWFTARRKILIKIYSKFCKAGTALEVGCGTGRNLEWLSQFNSTHGIECNDQMLRYASDRGLSVKKAIFPELLDSDLADNICLFDVLEHIEDDESAIKCLSESQNPGQRLFITVPAYQWLFSTHDKLHHHFRRYSKGGLTEELSKNGYRILYSSYFNTFLLPLALLVRLTQRLTNKQSGEKIGKANHLLHKVFCLEEKFLPKLSFPLGLSIVVVAEKK